MDFNIAADQTMTYIALGAGAIVALIMLLFFALITGYSMGRNSAEKPLISKEAKEFDQGPTEEPETGDIFKDAMEDETAKRISTV